MADQDLDRNETATPYKLEKAREKGQVAKSSDVVSVVVYASAIVYSLSQGWDAVRTQFLFDQMLLAQVGHATAGIEVLWPLVAHMLQNALVWQLPLFMALVIAAILGNVGQTGPLLSFEPLKADFDRLNPVSGFKKIWSLRALFDTARSCIKLTLLSGVVFYALMDMAPHFFNLSHLSPLGFLRLLLEDVSSLGLKILMVLMIIALIDWAFTRREFAKKMRMSKRDIKDEAKHRDGDPRVRSRMRELRMEMRKRSQSLRQTKTADVVLTNPTHVAVALRYEHGRMESPQLVAKGAGHLAKAMREIAAKHHIPVVRSPTLARQLFKELDVQHHVPPKMFADVARIIVWVFAMRERHAAAVPSGVER